MAQIIKLISFAVIAFILLPVPTQRGVPYGGAGAPTGACDPQSLYVDLVTNFLWGCKGGVWMQITPQAKRGIAGCTTGILAGNQCAMPITVTWPVAFTDTNYTAVCWPSGAPTNEPGDLFMVNKSTSAVTVNYYTIIALGSS